MAKDYKNTLNLPRTDFPMKADLVRREPQRLARWEREGLYARIQRRRARAPRFVLHDGPPFANGDVHIGTALNKILKDFIIKHRTLRGFRAPYVPGWDCHGLPIEFKVVQELRRQGQAETDPATIRRACADYARKYIDIQREQFRRLGVLGTWDQPYLTLDREYEAEELRLFADLVEQGFVYRGKKPVYWSIPCRTALAEAEVEYKDHVSQSVFVKFPVVGHQNTSLLIWTTTPWTLPANLAVAFNPRFSYSLVRVGEDPWEDYVLCTSLIEAVAAKCGWRGYQIIRSLEAGHFQGVEYRHPFCDRTGRLFPADFVEDETGTGFVHIAPGHGMDDYLLGLQEGLPIYSPVDDEGRFIHTTDLPAEKQMPAHMLGKGILEREGRSEANEVVIEELRRRDCLVHLEDYLHSYPHCWRSKTPVIFRAMDQWFIAVDHERRGRRFRDEALAEIGRVRWVPEWGRARIEGAVASRPDWCISRQRAWGVPIPAFYTAEGEPILDARVVRAVADLVEQHGTNIWFEKDAAELWSLVKPADWSGPDPVAKSPDTLDVWIDSGSSSRAVLMRREELRSDQSGEPHGWQADVYLEGSDQHRGWFQSSLLLSLAANGAAPFRTVLTHGFMVDADREKISKSRQDQGGYEKPQTAEAYVQQWGADILRLWVASQDYRQDIVVSEERIRKVAETYRLLRNTLRYQLANLYDFDPARHTVPEENLTGLDRWILWRFGQLEQEVQAAYEAYEFHVVYQRLSQFAAVELSAVYHDLVKDRLYTDTPGSLRRRSTQAALHRLVTGLCQLLAPVLAFTADEVWEFIPGNEGGSVHETLWAPRGLGQVQPEEKTRWEAWFQLREKALAELEQARQQRLIGRSLEARLVLRIPEPLWRALGTEDGVEELREVLNVSRLDCEVAVDSELQVAVDRAAGRRCERCWHWEPDVGADATHPDLCGRCRSVVEAS